MGLCYCAVHVGIWLISLPEDASKQERSGSGGHRTCRLSSQGLKAEIKTCEANRKGGGPRFQCWSSDLFLPFTFIPALGRFFMLKKVLLQAYYWQSQSVAVLGRTKPARVHRFKRYQAWCRELQCNMSKCAASKKLSSWDLMSHNKWENTRLVVQCFSEAIETSFLHQIIFCDVGGATFSSFLDTSGAWQRSDAHAISMVFHTDHILYVDQIFHALMYVRRWTPFTLYLPPFTLEIKLQG